MLSSTVLYYIFFFFFQAEDGIRDVAVTGVQTCALPISAGQREHEPSAVRQLVQPAGVRVATVVAHSVDPLRAMVGQRVSVGVEQPPPHLAGRRRDNLQPIRRPSGLPPEKRCCQIVTEKARGPYKS